MATDQASARGEAALDRFVAEKGPLVERALSECLPPVTERPAPLHRAMREAVLAGGKRVRPLLVVAAAEVLRKPAERVLPWAAAIEYVHTCSLVLDDLPCMDDAERRRGRPTLHRATSESTAILAANALLMRAFELAAESARIASLGRAESAEIVSSLAAAIGSRGMVGGQFVDLEPFGSRGDDGLDRLEYVHSRKTGSLFTTALAGSALLSRANTAEKEALVAYAKNVGLAYQIVDDLLDAEGDPEETGKDARKDKGKVTFVTLSSPAEARSIARDLVETAKSALVLFRARGAVLAAFADFVRDRRK